VKKVRKQIYLTVAQQERLGALARKGGLAEAEIIRNALDAYLLALDALPAEHPLAELAGMGASKEAGSGASEHDRVIYGC